MDRDLSNLVAFDDSKDPASDVPPVVHVIPPKKQMRFNSAKVKSALEERVPGNNSAKDAILKTLRKAYLNRDDPRSRSVLFLNGNNGVGKSSLIRNVAELTNIPLISINLDYVLLHSNSNLNEAFEDAFSVTLSEPSNFQEYFLYNNRLSKNFKSTDLYFKLKTNSDFTLIDLYNAETLISPSSVKSIQESLTHLMANPLFLSDSLNNFSTKNFTYIFSANLSSILTQKYSSGYIKRIPKVTNSLLKSLGYSESLCHLISDNVVDMKDLTANDFEKCLLGQNSQLKKSIDRLKFDYSMDINISEGALKVIAKYMEDSSNTKNYLEGARNFHKIAFITDKLLGEFYLNPRKKSIEINESSAKSLLYGSNA